MKSVMLVLFLAGVALSSGKKITSEEEQRFKEIYNRETLFERLSKN